MTAKKSAATEPPTEFDWLSLAQPTTEKDTYEVADAKDAGSGPWRVRDGNGLEFSTHVLVKGLTVLDDESPFDRSGVLRTPSGGIDTAPAE